MSTSANDLFPPTAAGIRFEDECLVVELKDGRTLSVPTAWYPRLDAASEDERKNWEFLGEGTGIHWPDVDEDISISALLDGKRSNENPDHLKKWLADRVA